MSLSESHTRETALRTRVFVCLIACLHFKYLPKIKIVFVHLNPVGEVLMPGHRVSVTALVCHGLNVSKQKSIMRVST